MIHLRVKALGALVAVLALGIAVAVPSFAAAEAEVAPGVPPAAESTLAAPSVEVSPLAEEGCPANQICFYNQTGFESRAFHSIDCSASGVFGLEGNRVGAKNSCGNKTNYLLENGSLVACMNPGVGRSNPGAFDQIEVALEYGALC
jgi:hypothetical protein